MELRPVTLEGSRVRLEPLSAGHVDELAAVAFDADTWRWLGLRMRERADVERWVRARLEPVAAGTALAFLQRDRATGRAFGSSSIFDVQPRNAKMEIGHTWIDAAHRGGGYNREAKLLLLRHCFEVLGAARVQLKTDARNERSQKAIAGLGAVREGVLRHFDVLEDGHRRDVVMFSLLAAEWPRVRRGLEASVPSASPGA